MKNKIIIKKRDNIILGILFCIIFLIIGLYPLKYGETIRSWSIYTMIVIFLITIIKPSLFNFITKLWIILGIKLGKFVSPFVMGFIYFLVVTPTGILLKIFKKDIMRLKKKKYSYWIDRKNKIQSMKKQF